MANESKVIVITGASSGIGEAIAKNQAKLGDRVVLGARREENLKKIKAEIEIAGGQAVYLKTDVTKVDEVKALAQKALDSYGTIDVWINNAGLMPQAPLSEQKINEWDRMIDVNIKGTLYGIAAAQPTFHKNAVGHFINLSSVAGLVSHANGVVYSATKWAVRAINEGLREEEAQAGKNVRVTALYPGAISSELTHTITDPEVRKNIDDFYANYSVPAARIAEVVEDVLKLPADTALNDIVIRPTAQVL